MTRLAPRLAALAAGVLFALSGVARAGESPAVPPPPTANAPAVPGMPPAPPPTANAPGSPGSPSAPGSPCPPDAPCPPPAPAAPVTWHRHKYPVQPFAPPGAFPVAPTGPGYYTLLQLVQGTPGDAPPRWPYPRSGVFMPPFYEINFTYLDAVPFDQRDWAEKLKRVPVGDHWLASTGGEARYRYNYETNSRLSGKTNEYDTLRVRTYADVWYEDVFRLYGEFLYGEIFNGSLPPLPRDVNRGDIQNLFFDLRLAEVAGDPVFLRFGQQELLYGSQRLVSPSDWGNNRQRFQLAKGFYRSDKWDADVFTGRPVEVRFNDLDPGDHNQWFTGAWVTYKPRKGTFLDAYYLNLDNRTPGVAPGRYVTGGYNVNTVGGRYAGRGDKGFLWDVEGAVQFGSWSDQSILAQMVSTYVGWNFKDVAMNPTVWAGYDFASGDPDPNKTGTHRTFNQLFAFGHYYFGFLDYVGRQNINDFTVQGYVYPMKWLTAGIQYHVFRLASDKDALYNAAGKAVRRDPTGAAGDDVGDEIDVVFNAHLTNRQDIFVSYSHFFSGRFVKATGPGMDGNGLYVQYSWRW